MLFETTHARENDSREVSNALSTAASLWDKEDFFDAVAWVHLAAAFAAQAGNELRCQELIRAAEVLRLEATARSDPPTAQVNAPRVPALRQPSFIDVRDSWLDPVELDARTQSGTCPVLIAPAAASDDEEQRTLVANATPPHQPSATLKPDGVPSRDRDESPQGTRNAAKAWCDNQTDAVVRRSLDLRHAPVDGASAEPELGWADAPTRVKQSHTQAASALTSTPGLERIAADLAGLGPLEDLPDDTRQALAKSATIQALSPRQPVALGALALVYQGTVRVRAEGAYAHGHRMQPRQLVSSWTTVPSRMNLCIEACRPGTVILTWEDDKLRQVLASCPWVSEELSMLGNHLQTIIAVADGCVRRAWTEQVQRVVLDFMEVQALAPAEPPFQKASPVNKLAIVGVGSMETCDQGDQVQGVLGPGDIIFSRQVLSQACAPANVRAGPLGATMLVGCSQRVAEMIERLPALKEVLCL